MRAAVVGVAPMSPASASHSGEQQGQQENEQVNVSPPWRASADHSGPSAPGGARRGVVDADQLSQLAALHEGALRRRIRHRQGQAAQRLDAEQPPDPDARYRVD